ncbi:DUF6907 domain-containing protein [Streptomyces sp. NPDC058268]|uniref:DUF6907 domain-containing protein n=1 Tax=Streptomyces sp. NPDC058268 TaxID=3346413 RepID=UPI0036F02BFA
MNPQEWKLTVTGANCPPWCTEDHADDRPEDGDTVVHISRPAVVPLPDLDDGRQVQLAFSTSSTDEYPVAGHTAPHLDLQLELADGTAYDDYVAVRTTAELDAVITALEDTVSALRDWRARLPASSP